MMKKFVCIIVTLIVGVSSAFAHGDHEMSLLRPGATFGNALVWISVGVVVATLILTLKYLFFPGEKDPNHIKNIVKDEEFE